VVNLRDPKTTRMLLILLGLGALAYVYFLSTWFPLGYKSQSTEISALEEQYQGLSREVTKAQLVAKKLPLLREEYTLLTQHWDAAQELLPDKKEIVTLLREITVAGQSSGVEFVLFKPKPRVPRNYVTEHPMEVKVQGGFHQLGTFLGQMSGMDRLVTVSNLTLKGRDASEGGVTMEASLVASAFTLGGLDPAAAEGTPAKGVSDAVKKVKENIRGDRRIPRETEE
jgi:type IV pilus assembly protein PilO